MHAISSQHCQPDSPCINVFTSGVHLLSLRQDHHKHHPHLQFHFHEIKLNGNINLAAPVSMSPCQNHHGHHPPHHHLLQDNPILQLHPCHPHHGQADHICLLITRPMSPPVLLSIRTGQRTAPTNPQLSPLTSFLEDSVSVFSVCACPCEF